LCPDQLVPTEEGDRKQSKLVSLAAKVKSAPGNGLYSFRIFSNCYIQMIKVGHDAGNFAIWILPKQQQKDIENHSSRGI
jgi:hypothetical protein